MDHEISYCNFCYVRTKKRNLWRISRFTLSCYHITMMINLYVTLPIYIAGDPTLWASGDNLLWMECQFHSNPFLTILLQETIKRWKFNSTSQSTVDSLTQVVFPFYWLFQKDKSKVLHFWPFYGTHVTDESIEYFYLSLLVRYKISKGSTQVW